MNTETYIPRLARNTRVTFVKKDHPKTAQQCTVLAPLPNPSRRAGNQWYDVRFDDRTFLRCQDKDLQLVAESASPPEQKVHAAAGSVVQA